MQLAEPGQADGESGSGGRIRASDQALNSRVQRYVGLCIEGIFRRQTLTDAQILRVLALQGG